jgi:hypothetical protein
MQREGDVWTVLYIGWNQFYVMFGQCGILVKLVVGDVWLVWYNGWNLELVVADM